MQVAGIGGEMDRVVWTSVWEDKGVEGFSLTLSLCFFFKVTGARSYWLQVRDGYNDNNNKINNNNVGTNKDSVPLN